MAIEIINVGSAPNDGTGDPLRTAYIKCNNNFGELYSRAQVSPPTTLVGSIGDQAGMYAYSSSYFYYCFEDYDGSSVIWAQVTQVGNVALSQIQDGTTNVEIQSAGGPVLVNVGNVSNIAVFTSSSSNFSNAAVSGTLSVTGNAAMGHVLPESTGNFDLGSPNLQWRSLYVSGNTIYIGNAQVSAVSSSMTLTSGTGAEFSISGDSAANTVATVASITAGNISAGNLNVTGNIVDTGALRLVTGSSGNVSLAPNGTNVLIATTTGANITGTLNATGNANVGNLGATNANLTSITASGNITGGNLSGTNIVGTLTTAAQTNITSVGTLGALTVTGNISGSNLNVTGNIVDTGALTVVTGSSGNISLAPNGTTTLVATTTGANVTGALGVTGNVSGGNLVTVGEISAAGNITTTGYFIGTVIGNITGNFVVPGGDTEIIFNGSGNAVASPNLTFSGGNLLTVTGNIASGNIAANAAISATGNITGGNISSGAGNIAGGNIQVTSGVTAATGAFSGNVTTGNISGTAVAGTISTAAQPNITSLGTLTSLAVTGNITSGNVSGTRGAFTNIAGTLETAAQTNITSVGTLGSLAVTGNITSGNVSGTRAAFTTLVGTLSTAAQTSITSVGTLGSLAVTGNITSGNVSGTRAAFTNIAGTLETAAQTNITSLGTLGSLAVTGNITSGNVSGTIGSFGTVVGTLATAAQTNITSVGTLGSLSVTGNITSGNISGTTGTFTNVAGTLSTAAQTNITSLGTLVALTVTNNVNGGNLVTAGFVSTSSISKTGVSGVGNIGSSSSLFNTVFATASTALYADLAESYQGDAVYPPGTVVKFGGEFEVTASDSDNDSAVAGVISTKPAYHMNSGLTGPNVAVVALAGRVPCRVQGPVRKGQMMVSTADGRARAETAPQMGAVIGKALENFDGDFGTIEIVVGRV